MQAVSVEKAVVLIPDGATLMVGGFMGVGTPERLMDEGKPKILKRCNLPLR